MKGKDAVNEEGEEYPNKSEDYKGSKEQLNDVPQEVTPASYIPR